MDFYNVTYSDDQADNVTTNELPPTKKRRKRIDDNTSDNKGKFDCEQCDSKYSSKQALTKHEKLMHQEFVVIYICPTCKKECFEVSSMKSHIAEKHDSTITTQYIHSLGEPRKNTGTKERKHPKRIYEKVICICGQSNSGYSSFKRHVNNKHEADKISKGYVVNYDEYKQDSSSTSISKLKRKESLKLSETNTNSSTNIKPKSTRRKYYKDTDIKISEIPSNLFGDSTDESEHKLEEAPLDFEVSLEQTKLELN